MRFGDDKFVEYLTKFREVTSSHPNCSRDGEWVNCKAIKDMFGVSIFSYTNKVDLLLLDVGGSTTVANNAQCTKQTLTSCYWFDGHGHLVFS
jgi:hypothetical protein